MYLFLNDCSLHEQFSDIPSFLDAIARLMGVRATAKRFGREVHCHRALVNAKPIPNMPLLKALNQLSPDQRRAAMSWLTRGGPFWDDRRRHGGGDWLECRGEIVTDSAVGEAAYRSLHGDDCGLASMTPSDWEYSSIDVVWKRADEDLDNRTATVLNWWDAGAIGEHFPKNRATNSVVEGIEIHLGP